MKMRRFLLIVGSVALAIAMVAVLINVGKIDLRVTLQQLKNVSLLSFTKLVVLNALLVYLSTEKWRTIDAAWRGPSNSVPSRTTSYALTSVGLAVGIILPVQLAMATARTLGTSIHGGALKRGTAGTLLEQGFDVFTVSLLAVASGVTWFFHGGAKTWTFCAAAAIALALLAAGPSVRFIQWFAAFLKAGTTLPGNRIFRSAWELLHSGILSASLARRLVVLSALRFGTVVSMSTETASAVGLHIPVWQMAAAIPFMIFASIIAVTPGGIGIIDLAGAGALQIFGTPLAIGAQWALANRVLVSASYLLVAACAVTPLLTRSISGPGTCGSIVDRL